MNGSHHPRANLKRRLTILAILLAWVASAAWLVFYEAYPEWRQEATGGYRTLLSRGILVSDEWMKISFQGRQIGYSHSSIDVDESDPRRQYTVLNRTLLQLNVMGTRQRISINVRAAIDDQYVLQSFAFVLSTAGYVVNVDGERIGPDTLQVTVRGAGSTQRLKITLPPDAVLYSPMTEMALRNLAPGQQVTLRIFNPVTLAPQSIVVRSLRRETIRHRQADVETTVLAATVDGMETLSWIDKTGRLVRQDTPFGWTMEACSSGEAFQMKDAVTGSDLLTALAVPVTGNTAAWAEAPSAHLRLRGAVFDPATLVSQRQAVRSATGEVIEVSVRADALPAAGPPPAAPAPELAPYLASTAFVQSDDARLKARAQAITGDWTNSVEAAMAIYTWVHRNVVKKPTVSLPSALDVLRQLEGDCNEHTYLFTGLARAAGLPCRIRVGLTLNEGRLYYHAWPSVYVGRWVDMDPTLGRTAVGAAYLSLFEGELSEQMKLMGVIGRLKVEVVP
jgi:hypothetical protein